MNVKMEEEELLNVAMENRKKQTKKHIPTRKKKVWLVGKRTMPSAA